MKRNKNKQTWPRRPRSRPHRRGAMAIVGLLMAAFLSGAVVMNGYAVVQPQDEASVPTSSQVAPSGEENPAGPFYKDVASKPEWVIKGDYADPETRCQFIVVASDALLKQREAEEELDERLVEAVHARIDSSFSEGAGRAIGVDLDYIRENLIVRNDQCNQHGVYRHLLRWKVPEANQEMLDSEFRDAFQCFTQVRFNDEFESWAFEQWENQLVTSRSLQTALIGVSTLLVLGLLFGYFKADHKTRGFYSGRLQTVGLVCFVALALLVWWLSTQFVWF